MVSGKGSITAEDPALRRQIREVVWSNMLRSITTDEDETRLNSTVVALEALFESTATARNAEIMAALDELRADARRKALHGRNTA